VTEPPEACDDGGHGGADDRGFQGGEKNSEKQTDRDE
jgi:hypothetical protein